LLGSFAPFEGGKNYGTNDICGLSCLKIDVRVLTIEINSHTRI
jgi:hypothetical protein